MFDGDIDADLVARLIAEQFPQWADLPVSRVPLDGWDNRTFRLGRELAVRLPSHERYVAQMEKEHTWLPVLRGGLPLAIPEPVALGSATDRFPRPWSIRRWIEGETATTERVADLGVFSADLAAFLTALHELDARTGPPPGPHSFFRGGPLQTYDAETRDAIVAVAPTADDARRLEAVWQRALSSTWQRAPVWVHGDMTASNILVRNGRLHAVIDFGCCAVGDPACDLVIAWTFLSGEATKVFRDRLPLDDATWQRARGWALWKALVALQDDRSSGIAPDDDGTARRLGWSTSARGVIDRILEDDARHGGG